MSIASLSDSHKPGPSFGLQVASGSLCELRHLAGRHKAVTVEGRASQASGEKARQDCYPH